MAVVGVELGYDELVLTKGRDFKWSFQNLDDSDVPVYFPAGSLFFEIYDGVSPSVWEFSVSGSTATIKVESEVVDTIPDRTKWQLVFKESGEAVGGDALARGVVRVQS